MDKAYWDKYYLLDNAPTLRSGFAYLSRRYMPESSIILDVGCGNGRDSFYFALEGSIVYGIDSSESAINLCKKKMNVLQAKCRLGGKRVNARFLNRDVLFDVLPSVNVIYAHFFLHCLTDREITRFLNRASNELPKNGMIFLEYRELGGVVPDVTHYRNLIDSRILRHEIERRDFRLKYFESNTGLSIHKGEDPQLGRIICKKK